MSAVKSSNAGRDSSTSPVRNATTTIGASIWAVHRYRKLIRPATQWQSLGSLRRRLRNCLIGMRAETYPNEAPNIVDLELYLAWRARGLTVETPAVRP
jgi:hypothetical protein